MKKLKRVKKFNESKDLSVNGNKKFDDIKLDLSRKFRELDMDFLNSISDKKFLLTAIGSYIYEIELIRRDYDGILSDNVRVDEEYLENFLNKTTKYISDLRSFFEDVKNKKKNNI